MPKRQQKGEKQIKKSVSKKKVSKPSKTEAQPVEKQTNVKSPPVKIRPSSVKKDVRKVSKKKDTSAQRKSTKSARKTQRLKSLGQKKSIKKELGDESTPYSTSTPIGKTRGTTNLKKETVNKSTSKEKKRERSRSKSDKEENTSPKMTTPSKSNKSTPSKEQSSPGSSSKSARYKEMTSSGKIPRDYSYHSKKGKRAAPSQPAKKKIAASKVKESSSNIESSSSIDLSAEQKKQSSSSTGRGGRRKTEVGEISGPDAQRISQEVEEVIKRIEDKKKLKKEGKLLDKKRKRGDSQALVTHTAEDFDYILQKNPNAKVKPFINLEDLSKHHLITYSDILLALLEVGQNTESYLFAYSSKSRTFWNDILQYKVLKKIFADFKAETLRKYWCELSKYDTEDATDLIKKHKSYLDKLPLKLGTIVSSISKLLSGKIKDLKQYIDNIQIDIRKREIYEHEFENPVTGELTKVKEVRTTYNTRKRYEPRNLKDFKGTTVNIVSLKEVYHENENLNDFQKVMKDIKKDDSVKFTYLNEKIEEEKKKLNTINEDDKFVFKAIDNVVDALSAEFKNYSTDFILETLQQNSMDIAKTYVCLKEPMKNKTVGFTPLDDKVLLRKQGEEYKILVKEKGKEAISEREEFLSH